MGGWPAGYLQSVEELNSGPPKTIHLVAGSRIWTRDVRIIRPAPNTRPRCLPRSERLLCFHSKILGERWKHTTECSFVVLWIIFLFASRNFWKINKIQGGRSFIELTKLSAVSSNFSICWEGGRESHVKFLGPWKIWQVTYPIAWPIALFFVRPQCSNFTAQLAVFISG